MTNVVGASFQAASWLARRRGNRRLGVALSGAGFGITGVAAYLGGHLSFVERFRLADGSIERGPASVAEPAWQTLATPGPGVDPAGGFVNLP